MITAQTRLAIGVTLMAIAGPASTEPIALHPDNPHYFMFRGEPTVLITSAEHYGAVLNGDFHCAKYLDALARDGMNHTRIFVGAYCEPVGAFSIERNTLAPATGSFISPWARSDEPGYANGGDKFDLSRWNPAYFARLRGFVSQASDLGIVIEVNLFCPFYNEKMWDLSPMNSVNNVNGIGACSMIEAYTLDQHGGLLEIQQAMTRKVVDELAGYDNLYYEIMNEPYQRDVPDEWQHAIIDTIVDAEKGLESPHLISLNIENGSKKVESTHPEVSIVNFHYAFPPDTVAMNYGLNLPIGDNETGFRGTAERHYRLEAWAFMLAGAALYNNLDYSFAVGHEDGTFDYPETQPGSGGMEFRRQLRVLGGFLRELDFINMSPEPSTFAEKLPDGVLGQALAEPGRQYAIYLCRPEPGAEPEPEPVPLSLAVAEGTYRVSWLDVITGETTETSIEHHGGTLELASPAFADDIALAIVQKG